jgi:hypothetical protein
VSSIPDIVIAGNRAKGHAEAAHQLGCVTQIVLDIRAVDGDVPGMDDEIGVLCGDPRRKRRPIVGKMSFAAAEMRVRDLDYPHSAAHKKDERSGIPAKTREQPAPIRRSA